MKRQMILRLLRNKRSIIFALSSVFFLFSCNYKNQEITIIGHFPKQETVSIYLYPINEAFAPRTIEALLTDTKDIQEIRFIVSKEEWANMLWFQLNFNQGITENLFLKELRINNIAVVDAVGLERSLTGPYNAKTDIKDKNLIVHSGGQSAIHFATQHFYQSHPIGLQLFLRLSFLATLVIFIFILTKQAPTQRLLLFTIALFLASIPFKIDYTNYTMGFMSLTMIIAFIRNKSRHFTWQPIFYALCAIYLMTVIGLSYTADFKLGARRLDTIIVLVIFPVIFSMIQFPKKNVILILRFFIWSVIAFCVFGLLSYATIVPELTWDMVFADSKLYAPLLMMWPAHPHPSYLSIILLMAVPITLYLRYQDGKQITFIEMSLGVSLPIIFTILGGARVGMIIAPLLLGLGYLSYCKFRPVLKWGLVVAGMVAMGVLLHLFPKTDDRFVDPIRSDLRKTAISAIEEKPIFGWGTGYVKPLIHSEERAHSLGIEIPYDLSSFHNEYLEDIVQFGIPGIIILLTLFGWMFWIGIREKNYLILSLLAIYVIFCWTESAFFISKGVIPFAFWLCFLMTNRVTLLPKDRE